MGITGIYVRTSVDKDNTSIDQQKQLGIAFCGKNNFEYAIYEDIGKSGFTIDDNDPNPFNNRPSFTSLVNDIKNKKISKVWVYEHSRLSRNHYGSAIIFNLFDRYNIELYENDKFIDLKDPQYQFMRQIMDAVSQLERNLIVNRTTRGLHHSINKGFRGLKECYGYRKNGKDGKGHTIWEPVQSEIENLKYFYEKYMEGFSINSIVNTVHKNNGFTAREMNRLIAKWRLILGRFYYTGYLLNTDGIQVYNSFKKGKINSIKELNNERYYIKSIQFPIRIVSIENWISVVERQKKINNIYNKKRRITRTEIGTGIVQCPYCELKYYFLLDKGLKYYKHEPRISSCGQKPKSMKSEKLDNILNIFFFYFYLVFDDTKTLIMESQKLIKLNQNELKGKIKTLDTLNRKLNKQIENFQSIYEKPENMENIDKLNLILDKETQLKKEMGKNDITLNQLKNDLEELNIKYNKDEAEFAYYDVKNTVIDFFERLSVNEKRAALIKIIKNCYLFGQYLVIDTGKLLFLFNIKEGYRLPESVYNEFKNDKFFKENFLTPLYDNYIKEFMDTPVKEAVNKYSDIDLINIDDRIVLHLIIRRLGDLNIKEYLLKDKIGMKRKLQNIGIDYTLTDTEKIISFTGDFGL